MILAAYTKATENRAELEAAVRQTFPSPENSGYFDEIGRRASASSACESLSALLLLSKTATKIGADPSKLVLRRGKNGKPYFEDSTLYFSISHSRGIVAVAVSDQGDVGIDVEAAELTDDKAKRLAERYFAPCTTTLSADDFLKTWVRREAYVKLRGMALADIIGRQIPQDANFYDFEACGFPAAISYFGDQEVNLISDFEEI